MKLENKRVNPCTKQDNAVIYPFPSEETPSDLYSVTVNGVKVPCYFCRVSAMPFNRIFESGFHQRPLDQTERQLAVFGMTGPVEVTVTVAKPFEEVKLRPASRGTVRRVGERTVAFTVQKPGQLSFEVDGRHGALHLFADAYRPYERERQSATYYFGPGIHHVGELEVKSGETVFIEAGAILHGAIHAEDAENIGVYGNGILDGTLDERRLNGVPFGHLGLANFLRCRNVIFDGPILRDSEMWCVTAINCENLNYCNLKCIGMWRYNSDGFDFVNSKNVRVSGCFLRTYDDSIVIKGIRLPDLGIAEWNNENYLIEDCVVWCDWGGALEIGAETVADEYFNIVYRDCDIIGVNLGAMRVHSGDRAVVHGVLYDNVRLEYTKYDLLPLFQKSEDETYRPEPFNGQIALNWMYCGVWSGDGILGNAFDITYRNIHVVGDEGVEMPHFDFSGADAEHGFRNIRIEGMTFNGEPVKPKVLLSNEFVWDVTY